MADEVLRRGKALPVISITAMLLAGLLLSFFVRQELVQSISSQQQGRFDTDATIAANAATQRVKSIGAVVDSTAGFASAIVSGRADQKSPIKRSDLFDYAGAVMNAQQYPGLVSLSIADRVAPVDVESYSSEVMADDANGFIMPDLAGSQGAVVRLAEPAQTGRYLVGRNLAAEPGMEELLQQSVDIDSQILAGPVWLNGTSSDHYFVIQPVYGGTTRLSSMEQRNATQRLWIVAEIDPRVVVSAEDLRSPHIGLQLVEASGTTPTVIGKAGDVINGDIVHQRDLLVKAFNRTWTAQIVADGQYDSSFESRVPLLAAAAGVVLTFLATVLLVVLLTSRKRALALVDRRTAELRTNESRFRTVLDGARAAIFEVNPDGTWSYLPQTWKEITGYAPQTMIGTAVASLFLPADRERLQELFDKGREVTVTPRRMRYVHATGEVRWAEIFLRVNDDAGGSGTFTDAHERHILEEQLQSARRGEALVTLAGGMAHEINTPLQILSDNLTFIGNAARALSSTGIKPNEADFYRAELPGAIEASTFGLDRIAGIVSVAKSMTAIRETAVRPVTLKDLIVDAVARVQKNTGAASSVIDCQIDTMPSIIVDENALREALIAIITNAVQALDGNLVGVSDDHIEAKVVITARQEFDGTHVTVVDNGCGMTAAVRERAFDPFFSTRDVGEGVGSGLAVARMIVVDQHDGKLEIRSEENIGTTVEVTLPLSHDDAAHGSSVGDERTA